MIQTASDIVSEGQLDQVDVNDFLDQAEKKLLIYQNKKRPSFMSSKELSQET